MSMRQMVAMAAAGVLLAGAGAAWAADADEIWKAKCQKCHGDTGQSDTPSGKSMKVPPIAGDAKVAGMAVEELAAQIKGTKKHPAPVKGLSDEELNAVAAKAKALAAP